MGPRNARSRSTGDGGGGRAGSKFPSVPEAQAISIL